MPPIATYQCPWQIRFVDTDASGFAHFSSYIHMMEETEYAFLRSRGLSVVLYDERGTLGFPRLNAELTVIQPLRFEQVVEVRLRLTMIDGKQIVYEFEIVDDQNQTAVSGKFTAACCRFPVNQPPFAILIPDFVEVALRGDVVHPNSKETNPTNNSTNQ